MRFDLWEFKKHSFRIETRDIDGKMCMEAINGNLDIREAGNTTAVSHLVFSVSNLHFNTPGVINFVLFIDDKEVGYVPLYIKQN